MPGPSVVGIDASPQVILHQPPRAAGPIRNGNREKPRRNRSGGRLPVLHETSAARRTPQITMTRVISLGLDGAAWHKLDGLIDRGALPNLARLVEDGARAPLRTVLPPVTCPAWRCSTTGKNPGKLGVFWWLNLDRETGRFTSPDANAFDSVDVWNYLSEAGHRCAVVNVPLTYPPDDIDGVVVSGFGAPFEIDVQEGAAITRPEGLHDHLIEEYDWQIAVDDLTAPDGPERAYDLIRSRFELLDELLERDFDYLHLTIFYVNMLQHKFGDGPETDRAWRIIDDRLGDLLEEDALLLIYSDHGHSTVERTFGVNRWLLERGDLSIESRAGDSLFSMVYGGLKTAGVSPRRVAGLAKRTLPTEVYDSLVTSGYPISSKELTTRVDWADSTAVALSQGPVYLNRERLGDDYDAFRRRLRTQLQEVTYDGDPILERVHFGEDVYHGPYVDEAPDLLLVPGDGWELYGGITPDVVEDDVSSWTSGNDPVGMLALAGEDVANVELSERSILDVAPTVLQYLGCDLPADMDGDVLDAAFATDLGKRTTRSPIQARSSEEGVGDAGRRSSLADLGYFE